MSEPINIPKIVLRRRGKIQESPESFPPGYSTRHLNIETDTIPENFKSILPIITEYEIQTLLKTGWIRLHCGSTRDALFYCKRLTHLGFRSWVD